MSSVGVYPAIAWMGSGVNSNMECLQTSGLTTQDLFDNFIADMNDGRQGSRILFMNMVYDSTLGVYIQMTWFVRNVDTAPLDVVVKNNNVLKK